MKNATIKKERLIKSQKIRYNKATKQEKFLENNLNLKKVKK